MMVLGVLGWSGWLGCLAAPAADPGNLGAKEAFILGLPQGYAFRGEMSNPNHRNYEAWEAAVAAQNGVIRKFMTEELPRIKGDSPAWAERYVREHPEKLMLLHLNGEARQVTTEAEVHQRYFPGHWVYQPGTLLTSALSRDATELSVEDSKPFKVDAYLDHGDNDDGKRWFPQILCIVPIDGKGKRDWYKSEFVIVTQVDKKRKTVSVKRGQLFSSAKTFAAGRTYVAPLAAGIWGGAPMAFFNLSSACPKDRQGRSAGDVFAAEIAGWFGNTGPLAAFNGVAFDVNYWQARDESWDVDNDGVGDGGMLDGVNIWRLGDWKFLNDLRRRLGDGHLITADGQHPGNQQAVGVLDGIESEGLVQHNDGFRGFSRAVNTHLYWTENNPRPLDFRYVVLKLKNPADEARGDQLRRLAIGTACCLGARTTEIPPGVMPAEFSAYGSLGMPEGALLRPARQTPDLLKGGGLSARLEAKGCTLSRRADRVEIVPKKGGDPVTVTLKDLKVPAGDLTIFLDMQAIDPLDGFGADTFVPRNVSVDFSEVPDYGEKRYNAYYTELNGYIGTHKRSVMAFYLRRPDMPEQTMDVTFTIEGGGRSCLYGLTAHSAADTLVRVFNHGVVAVNPSMEPQTVSLSGRSVQVPALDAVFVPR
jgi:hypothetical protein